jgi:large subunit ribosomal protein L9
MKVILLHDVENLGRKNDVKDVPSGFVRNFLIPKGLVVLATKESLEKLEIQKKKDEENAENELKEMEKIVSKLDGEEVEIQAKMGDKGRLFESINKQKISDKLKEMGYKVEKTQIELESPIKEAGEYMVKLKFEHNLEAEIKIIISESEEK